MKHKRNPNGGWFRFYNKVLDDPKVQTLPGELFKTWVNLLCLASSKSGALPSMSDMAFKLRLSVKDMEKRIIDLKQACLIDEAESGRFAPHDWNEMQFVSDVSTGRVQRFRERKEAVSETFHEAA